MAAEAITNKKNRVKAFESLLGHRVYLIVSKNYVDRKNGKLSSSRKKILIEDYFWLDAITGRIYKYMQIVNGHVIQSFEIKKIMDMNVNRSTLSVNVPKGTKKTNLSKK